MPGNFFRHFCHLSVLMKLNSVLHFVSVQITVKASSEVVNSITNEMILDAELQNFSTTKISCHTLTVTLKQRTVRHLKINTSLR